MKLQRTTLILLASALCLGGFVYISEIQRTHQQEAAKTRKQPIFSFKEDQIQSLTIYINEETLEFERVTGKEPDWRMKTPKDTPASDASVSFLLNLLVEGKSDRSFPIQTQQLPEYGFDKPLAIVKVQLKNQQTHQLILGKPDFNRSFLYAQVDPPPQTPQSLKVLLVPIDFEYALKRPMSEWQSKEENPASSQVSPTQPNPSNSPASPTPQGSPASPTPKSSQPSPTPNNSQPSPTPKNSQPSPTPQGSPVSPTPNNSQLSPTPKNPQPSPSAESSQQSPTPNNSQPLPTPKSSN